MKRLGDNTKWGTIVAVGWVGERYYWMRDRHGTISMMPADAVEDSVQAKENIV